MNKFKTIALLPIKAHSARVTGKNFRPFAGRPLFQWILDTLLALPAIEQVVINTDAESILRENGLKESDRVLLRQRKPELCGDLMSMNRVLEDDVQAIEAETYVMTHTTNPLLSAETIQSALDQYLAAARGGTHDSLFSVNRFQTRFYREDASPINHDPNNLLRTQDLEPWFEENSNLYIFSRGSFGKTRARIGQKPLMFETPRMESVDIDDHLGWRLAEILTLSRLLFEAHGGMSSMPN